jgi:PqqD family protein of HPr-rel-A system
MTGPDFSLRRLGDASVVFDPRNWQTHLLPPAATVVVDVIEELREQGRLGDEALATALRDDLELDPDSPAIADLLRTLREIGILPA